MAPSLQMSVEKSNCRRVRGVGSQGRGQSRSAGFQPAVSPISNRQNVAQDRCAGFIGASAGWKRCDTAGWKPALRPTGRTLSIAMAGELVQCGPVLLRPKVLHSLLQFSKLRKSNRCLEVISAIGLRYGEFSTNSH